MGKLLKTFGIYFMGTIVNRFMGFVIMSIATYQILPNDYGYFTIANNMINIIMTLLSVQAWMAIIRFVFDFDTLKGKQRVVSNGLFIEFIAFFIYTIGFIILALCTHMKEAFSIYFLGASYMLVQNMTFTCRGLGYNKLFVISGVFGSFMQLLSCIIFLFGLHWHSSALILATAISYFSQGAFIEFFLQNFRKFSVKDLDFRLMGKMLRYCIPTSLNQGSYWINTQACTLIISIFLGEAAVGIYSAPSKLTSLIGMIVMVFNYAWQEFTFSISKDVAREKQYNFALEQFVRFISCCMLFLIPMTSIFFSLIIGPKYAVGKSLVPLLYLGTFLDALASFIGSIMQAEKKVKTMFLSQIIGAALTVVIMLTTLPIIHLQSAGLAMTVCFAFVIFIRIIGLKKRVRLHLPTKYLLHYSIVFIITSLIYLYCNKWINLIYALFLCIYCLYSLRRLIQMFMKAALKKFLPAHKKKAQRGGRAHNTTWALATNNIHKLEEYQRMLAPFGITLKTPSQLGVISDPEEIGNTFEENAYIKASALFKQINLPVIADDSGLSIDALNGRPGVYSARYGSKDITADERNLVILKEMREQTNRAAHFTCVICYINRQGNTRFFKGVCEGKIGNEPKGNHGFAYDHIFYIGNTAVAELSPAEKDKISHRSKALKQLVNYIQKTKGNPYD